MYHGKSVHILFLQVRADEAEEIPRKGEAGRLTVNQLAVICSNKEVSDHYPIYVFMEQTATEEESLSGAQTNADAGAA